MGSGGQFRACCIALTDSQCLEVFPQVLPTSPVEIVAGQSGNGGHNLQLGLGVHYKIKHIPKQPKAKKQHEEGETWKLGLEKVRTFGSKGSRSRSTELCQEPGQVLKERNATQRTLVDC